MISLNKVPVVLTIIENENYQSLLGNVDAIFYVYRCGGSKKINSAPPANHRIINDLTPNIRPDILLSQNKISHYGIFKNLREKYGVPLLSLYHNLPTPKDVDRTISSLSDEDIFFSSDHSSAWGKNNAIIIPPCPLRKITKISEPLIYVNKDTSFDSMYSVLNYMAAGNCIISPAIYEINNIVKHGYSGFLYKKDNPEKQKEILNQLGKNDDLIIEMGANGQKRVTELFSHDKFTENWNNLIRKYLKGKNN